MERNVFSLSELVEVEMISAEKNTMAFKIHEISRSLHRASGNLFFAPRERQKGE